MGTIIAINIFIFVVAIIGYIIWNLLKKVEKLEEMIGIQEKYITDFYDLVKQSEQKIKEIDTNHLFQ
jgi:energy-converting hydrogenase Eha subunit H